MHRYRIGLATREPISKFNICTMSSRPSSMKISLRPVRGIFIMSNTLMTCWVGDSWQSFRLSKNVISWLVAPRRSATSLQSLADGSSVSNSFINWDLTVSETFPWGLGSGDPYSSRWRPLFCTKRGKGIKIGRINYVKTKKTWWMLIPTSNWLFGLYHDWME